MRTVVLRPPREVASANDVVEHKRNDRPRHVVERGSGRDKTSAAQDHREVDVFKPRVRPPEHD